MSEARLIIGDVREVLAALPRCPDGLVMCCMCFDRFPLGELYLDPADGKRVDVCQDCHDKDEAAFRVKRWPH